METQPEFVITYRTNAELYARYRLTQCRTGGTIIEGADHFFSKPQEVQDHLDEAYANTNLVPIVHWYVAPPPVYSDL